MRKQGYTLAEILVAIGIVGVIAALMLPIFNKIQPDQEKAMYLKAYKALNAAVTAVAADKTIYPSFGVNNDSRDYSVNPLYNTRAVKSLDRGIDLPAGPEKFGRALAWAFNGNLNGNYNAAVAYTGAANSNFVPTFTLPNGMQFMVTTTMNINTPFYSSEIWVDLDGDRKGRNCSISTCETPDRFKFVVAANGAMTPADAKGEQYIANQLNLRKLANVTNSVQVGAASVTTTDKALRKIKRKNDNESVNDESFKERTEAVETELLAMNGTSNNNEHRGVNSDNDISGVQKLTCRLLGFCGSQVVQPCDPTKENCDGGKKEPDPVEPPSPGKPCSSQWVYRDNGYVVTTENMAGEFMISPLVSPFTTPQNGYDRLYITVRELTNVTIGTREAQARYINVVTYNDKVPESIWPTYQVFFKDNAQAEEYRTITNFKDTVTLDVYACNASDSYCNEANAYAKTTRVLKVVDRDETGYYDNEVINGANEEDFLPNEMASDKICACYGEFFDIEYDNLTVACTTETPSTPNTPTISPDIIQLPDFTAPETPTTPETSTTVTTPVFETDKDYSHEKGADPIYGVDVNKGNTTTAPNFNLDEEVTTQVGEITLGGSSSGSSGGGYTVPDSGGNLGGKNEQFYQTVPKETDVFGLEVGGKQEAPSGYW